MNNHRLFKFTVLALVIVIAAGSVVSLRTLAASVMPAPPRDGPKFLMVNLHQFDCDIADPYGAFFNDELINNGPELRFYQAALTLPDNIKINKMVVYFTDNNNEQDLIVALWRFDPATGSHLEMATVGSWGTQGQYLIGVDPSIIEPTITQQRYSYYLEVAMPPGGDTLRVSGVRIDYSPY